MANGATHGQKPSLDLHTLVQRDKTSSVLTFEKTKSFPVTDTVIDIDSKMVNNELYILSRMANYVNCYRLNDSCLEQINESVSSSHSITSCTLSSDIDGCWLQSNDNFNISLFNPEWKKKSYWKVQIPELYTSKKLTKWCTATFGYPSNLGFISSRTSIYSCDFRHRNLSEMISSSRLSDTVNMNDLCGLVSMKYRPYLLSITTEQVVLLDQRSCKVPVLSWAHMLMQQPRRAVLQTRGDLDILVLSNNIEKRVALVGIRGCTPDYSQIVQSACLTNHCDLYNPMTTVAHTNGLWFGADIKARFDCDINGLATVGSNASSSEFDVLFSSCNGDVFSQHFTLDLSKTVDNTVHSACLNSMKKWQESLEQLSIEQNIVPNHEERILIDATRSLSNALKKKLPYKGLTSSQKLVSDITNDKWDLAQLVDLYKSGDKFASDMKKPQLNWMTILMDGFKTEKDHVRYRIPDRLRMDPIKRYFSTRFYENTIKNKLESCSDNLSLTILRHFPFSCDKDQHCTLDEIDGDANENIKSEVYRAVPFCKSLCASSLPKKVRESPTFPEANRPASKVTGGFLNSSAVKKRTTLQEFLSTNLSLVPQASPYCSSSVVLKSVPSVLGAGASTPALPCTSSGTVLSTAKKRKRNAGF